MDKFISIQGPIEKIDGKLTLMIPLAVGGQELFEYARGISVIEGEFLKVVIRDWLAEKLGISEGTLVDVDNEDGKFNIRPVGPTEAKASWNA
jgi:hypothetical protein